MSKGSDFAEYVFDKANDVVDLNEEISADLEDGAVSVDEYVNDAVEAFRRLMIEATNRA